MIFPIFITLIVIRIIQLGWNFITPRGCWTIDHYWPFAGTIAILIIIRNIIPENK